MSDDFIFDELLTIVPDLIKLEQTQPTAETNEFEIDFSWCWFWIWLSVNTRRVFFFIYIRFSSFPFAHFDYAFFHIFNNNRRENELLNRLFLNWLQN